MPGRDANTLTVPFSVERAILTLVVEVPKFLWQMADEKNKSVRRIYVSMGAVCKSQKASLLQQRHRLLTREELPWREGHQQQ